MMAAATSVCSLFLIIVQLYWTHAHVNIKSSWPQVQHIRRLLDTTQYSLTSSVSSFSENGQITQATVQDRSGASAPQIRAQHLLALHPSPSDPTKTVPITFVNVSRVSANYLDTGRATISIKLLNVRSPGLVLRLVSNSPLKPLVLAESAVIRNLIQSAPGQIRLAQHADGRSIVVQWVSGSDAPQQLEYSSTPWGLQPHSSTNSGSSSSSSSSTTSNTAKQLGIRSVTSTSHTYSADMMCGPPANSFGFLAPGHLHVAVIPAADIGYEQQLNYRVGSYSAGWSQVFSFTPAPSAAAVAANRATFTFLVFNDVGQENAVLFDNVCPPYCPAGWVFEPYTTNSTKLLKHLVAEVDATLGLLVGDVSYANGYLVDWDYFGYQFEPAFARWPLMLAAGNHEKDAQGSADVPGNSPASGGECGVPYSFRFYTPAWHPTGPQAGGSLAAQAARVSTAGGGISIKSDTARHTLTPLQQPSKQQASLQAQSRRGQSPAVQQEASKAPCSTAQQLKPSTARSFYSFEMGGVHFVMLDTEAPSEPDSPQGKFTAADLAQVDRQRTPWLVVGLHRQMVGPTTDPVNVKTAARLQHDLEDLFLKYKVDLVLQGHDHAYARTCPYAKGRCASGLNQPGKLPAGSTGSNTVRRTKQAARNQDAVVESVQNPTAPIYILAGHAGAGFTHAFPSPLPDWVVFGAQDMNGYLRVTVKGNRLRVVSVSTDNGSIMDGVEVVRVRGSS